MRAYRWGSSWTGFVYALSVWSVALETNSLIQRKWKPVSLTVLCACTNQVDDVLVPSNILHRVHFRQEVSQLVLSSIGWKIRQIIDFLTLLSLPPVLQDSREVRFYVKALWTQLQLSKNCFFFLLEPFERPMNYFLEWIAWAVRAADEFLERKARAVRTADEFSRTDSSSRSNGWWFFSNG